MGHYSERFAFDSFTSFNRLPPLDKLNVSKFDLIFYPSTFFKVHIFQTKSLHLEVSITVIVIQFKFIGKLSLRLNFFRFTSRLFNIIIIISCYHIFVNTKPL